jgi:hypothetical protein
MKYDRSVLPGWGWTEQEVFKYLTEQCGLKPESAIREMNVRGRALRWEVARLENLSYEGWETPRGLLGAHAWRTTKDGEVTIAPAPSRYDLAYDPMRFGAKYNSPGEWQHQDAPFWEATIAPADLTFMTDPDSVRDLWPPRALSKSKAGAPPKADWGEVEMLVKNLWDRYGDPRKDENRIPDWKSETDIIKKIQDHLDGLGISMDERHVRRKLAPILEKLRRADI